MPELPEVETVRATLEFQLGQPQIADVRVFYRKLIDNMDVETFQTALRNQHILAYHRIGKYLIFELDEHFLVSHLRMEGKYYVENQDAPYDPKHTHSIIAFCDGRELRYHDTRKFGRMYLYPKQEALKQQKAFAHTGYDVFDESLTPTYLYEQFHPRNIVLKQALLDQSVMAGVGNIYADEICFASGLHPETKINKLRKKDFEQLLYETRRILQGAINAGGTTIRSYTSSLGVDGRFQLQLKVHSKKEEPCLICGEPIVKKVVATRGTYYCPNCQRSRKPRKKIRCIGLTGVMGAGKSSVIEILESFHIPVLDCDNINAQLLQKGEAGYRAIKQAFQEDLYDEEDQIDRQKMSALIFQNETKKTLLESILHPLIKQEIKTTIQKLRNVDLVVVEVPLLFEVKWESFFDEIWTVACEEALLLQRLHQFRGIEEAEARRRLAHQMSQEEKIKRSDVVLMNTKDIAYLKEQIIQALQGHKKGA